MFGRGFVLLPDGVGGLCPTGGTVVFGMECVLLPDGVGGLCVSFSTIGAVPLDGCLLAVRVLPASLSVCI